MSPRPPLPGGPYLVLGLARSGVAAAELLRARGEEVIGCDAGAPPEAGRLRPLGVELHLDAPGDDLVPRARTLVKSPGVPQDAPAVRAARDRGLTVIGELELAWRLLPNAWIAVTGTNGKTTTTELVGHLHREAAVPCAVAGNVGTPLSSLVGTLDPGAVVVCEASSFQLEDTVAFAPDAGVLLNLAPDHLDRHGTWEAYVAAKLQVFARQGNDDVAVAPEDECGLEDLGGCARRVHTGTGPEADLAHRNGALWWDGGTVLRTDELRIRGPHNVENAMAAAAVCLARGMDREAVADGLRTFRGVPHRLEEVATRDGVLWVNDSKATNVDAALVALRAFPGGVHLIAGGRGKGADFAPLGPVVAERCAAVHLVGEDAGRLAAALAGTGVPVTDDSDLGRAVAACRAAARPGETVLLAPACASFDQYPDFEARGEHFRRLVLEG